MSSIEKLSIQGIRSFSPQQPSVIEFYTPLTLIVGLNGSGKTTIIECLKYATTGELPPNSKGGAFIHDPKLAHESEVKAQIKLKFKNLNQQQLVLIRSLQSTQKKVKLEMKTLEALLTFRDPQTNQKMTLSSRCADFDAEIPMHMGVSAAILENVIFCHQEDSLWPLSEPAVLKRKFDDIFAATRYAKALDAIKSVSKGIKGEIQVEKVKLDHFMEKNEKAEKIQIGMEGIKRKIEKMEIEKSEIEQENKRLNEKKNEYFQQKGEISGMIQMQKEREKKMKEMIYEISERLPEVKDEECDNVIKMIEEEIERNGKSNLEKIKKEIFNLKDEISEIDLKCLEKKKELETISNLKFRKVDSAERTILDNLRLRNQIKRLNDLKIEIDKLKLEFSKFKFDLNKKNKLESEITNLISQKSVIFGELKQLEIQKNSYSLELKSDYKNVREKYSEQLIKVTSLELSQSDLDKYGKALDSAIMKYHSVKMKEINKIICELWTNTYQGTDIDTVEIRSEKECKDKGNRSYNYRVVMLKGTTELDMRGRSSAGQRVLASIIIRLALAESFGANCGILALDEPTTNLDQANIESLARSLSDIIKTKRQQANFQLIVITHDEEFVRLLGQSDYVDYYWRVARDNNQHSVIERQSITSR
ncbi:P-loop containing nucleoside triphosphate hydrolase protein [Rozella allomycis CSF55]|uniref:DNA repair protein RAD50 n=1 Tax=Rozella allomycis (strain CSF55) TaxID=988480 RepID=A0A4P9YER8_ROZAC|nr:P-loop containing nucleoside triphosphate hydrolase protein [Rozella allomycis CSF55]